ncbi:MAG: hypoxanthine-guanine phosphoribosyltransferase [Vezdaea aestivalis]|nr:MAG: hypoxanthine-guanine phosphoribosyltransferase [Vezdaea aestivalis]
MSTKVYVTYNQVHKLCQEAAPKILDDFRPNLMIAIGGGGYVPARILRSFLKRASAPNIPIQAIGLSLYEKLSTTSGLDEPVETPGTEVKRTQWLDLSSLEMASLVGKNILIVDEVDDSRRTLDYAVKELEKDVEAARQKLMSEGKETTGAKRTQFSIFVLHNKDKPKDGHLPREMEEEHRYLAARTVPDVWICYPWEATQVLDIDEHDRLAEAQPLK